VAVVALLLGAAVEWQLARNTQHRRQEVLSADSGVPPFRITGKQAQIIDAPKHGTPRPVYGHALVRGGIRSIAELMALISADPQLAEHYRGFDFSQARIITLDHNVLAYVSYRFEHGIYWKTRPTIIREGEDVITDGTNFIRAACGNRIAYAPGAPTNLAEPTDVGSIVAITFDSPSTPFQPAIAPLDETLPPPGELLPPPTPLPPQVTETGGGGAGGGPTPPTILFPSGGGTSHFSADEFHTISMTLFQHSVKLPATLLTLLVGFLLVLAVQLSFRRMS
jgi:hypothetical protein